MCILLCRVINKSGFILTIVTYLALLWVNSLAISTRSMPLTLSPLPKTGGAMGLYTGPWFIGTDYNSGACKGHALDRYSPSCYSEYEAIIYHYLVDRLKNEVLKDVR